MTSYFRTFYCVSFSKYVSISNCKLDNLSSRTSIPLNKISLGDNTPSPTILHIYLVSLTSTVIKLSTSSVSSASVMHALHTIHASLLVGVHHFPFSFSFPWFPVEQTYLVYREFTEFQAQL